MTPPVTPSVDEQGAQTTRVRWLGLGVGFILIIIGVRFFWVPGAASFTFGVAHPPVGDALHHVIGVRDIWLGALAVAFVAFREWRALAFWMLGAGVTCLTDAWIVSQSTGNSYAIAFHLVSGVLCLLLFRGAWIIGKNFTQSSQ
ncbi:MAG: DUF4267 domain-containing protein [Hyphomicrobiaceae bacterium]